MNLLLFIFLSGLAMKGIVSLIRWLSEMNGQRNWRWTNASKRIAELGNLAPEQYLSIRSDAHSKIRRLPAVSNTPSQKVIPLIGPLDKKSA